MMVILATPGLTWPAGAGRGRPRWAGTRARPRWPPRPGPGCCPCRWRRRSRRSPTSTATCARIATTSARDQDHCSGYEGKLLSCVLVAVAAMLDLSCSSTHVSSGNCNIETSFTVSHSRVQPNTGHTTTRRGLSCLVNCCQIAQPRMRVANVADR